MDKVLQTFEGLIRRSVAPSVTFLVIFAVGEIVSAEVRNIETLGDRTPAQELVTTWFDTLSQNAQEAAGLFALAAFLVVVGLSYGLSATQQILFDNRLKRNFDPGPRPKWLRKLLERPWLRRWRRAVATEGRRSIWSEGRVLRALRRKVVARLVSEPRLERFRSLGEWNDYLLYEILGGIDPTNTRKFVDTAKSVGIVFSSAIAVAVWHLAVHWRALDIRAALVLVGLIVVFYWLGREATLTQYRTRALRLYVNFLMMPTERLERRLLRPDEMAGPRKPGEG